jgi:hypothetical protein
MNRSNKNLVFLLLAIFFITWSVFLRLIPAIGGLWVILMFLAMTVAVFVVLIKPIGR